MLVKSKIEDIEGKMLEHGTNIECITKHNFSEGVYVREITMPTGSIILGAEHTTTHLNIVSKGICILVDLDTGENIDIVAPTTFESKAGVRKLLYIVEECVWSTVHVTDETDVEKLEAELTVMSDTYKEIVGTDKFIEGGKVNELYSSRACSRRNNIIINSNKCNGEQCSSRNTKKRNKSKKTGS